MNVKNCENCGRTIGKLERAYVFEDHNVCQECYERLRTPEGRSQPEAISPGPIVQGLSQGTIPATSGMATASFVLSLIGIILPPLLIIALVLGLVASSRIKKSGGLLAGRGLAVAGTTISFIAIGLAILAVAAVPIMRGRIDAAKWSEGKAMMGTIATGIRAYHAERGPNGPKPTTLYVSETGIGFERGDLTGTYFGDEDLSLEVTSMNPLKFTITCVAGKSGIPDAPSNPQAYTLTEDGIFTPK